LLEQPVESLIDNARRGDRSALTALIRVASPGIYRFALRMTRSEEEARDVTQETFLRMMRNLERYDPAYNFNTWLYRIARNLCIDRARHRSRWRMAFHAPAEEEEEGDPMAVLPDQRNSQLEGLLSREMQERIERCLHQIKPNYREVLVLFHFEELSYQEIAQVLQIPIGTVMNRIFRARQQLREALGDALGDALAPA